MGLKLLKQPVLPLVSMVQFFLMTGSFDTVEAVINELPETIETESTLYDNPIALCHQYLDQLRGFESLKSGELAVPDMVTEQGEAVDAMTAGTVWILQQVLSSELEKINSALCAPCGCVLCCTGPESSMSQEFFEIPLTVAETAVFDIPQEDTTESRQKLSMDEESLSCGDLPFYAASEPKLFHWRNGWSLILPRETRCPNLAGDTGRCKVYSDRPTVCRRPQIFPYIIEPLEEPASKEPRYRIRNSLLGIIDCPYVESLKDEIAAYAAASELELVLSQNKQ